MGNLIEDMVRKEPQDENEITSVQMSVGTRERLKSRGRKGETYEDVIKRLLDKDDKEEGGN